MTPLYLRLKEWFNENYGHLGYDMSTFYQTDDLICRFDILQYGEMTKIQNLNLEKIMDFTVGNSELRKLLFDALFRQQGYRLDNDFVPLKKINKLKL